MKKGKFDLSHGHLLSCNMGNLVPIGCFEALPGDVLSHKTTLLLRTQPLLAPVMHRVQVRIHHYFVPYRLIWDDWEDFITGGPDGLNASTFPTIALPASTGLLAGSLGDYLGLPIGIPDLPVSALPYRAYALIWNEHYRDQDLQSTPLTIDTTDGVDSTTNQDLQYVSWPKDYFTKARPWEQKGPSITIPIGDSAPVMGIALHTTSAYTGTPTSYKDAAGNAPPPGTNWDTNVASSNNLAIRGDNTSKVPDIYADLSGASSITVAAMREALALQTYEENRARYGSRYSEYLRQAFGVRPADARLQRPEYLGGGMQAIQFSEVLQTAEGTNQVGTMRGHGIGAMRSNRYVRFVQEHGVVMSMMSVVPEAIYMEGIARMWNRRNKEDFYTPELAHIGQQAVLNKELMAGHASPDDTFGYSDRYAEYRSEWSRVSGEFQESTLNHWHLARDLPTDVALNSDFIECVPTERVFPVASQDVLYVKANHGIRALRCVDPSARSFIR